MTCLSDAVVCVEPRKHFLQITCTTLLMLSGMMGFDNGLQMYFRYRLKASSCPNIYRNSMATINDHGSSSLEFFEDLRDVICDMMDVRLLTNFK